MHQRQQIERLVYRSLLALDDRDFKGFLDLCDTEFRYKVAAFSRAERVSKERRKVIVQAELTRVGWACR